MELENDYQSGDFPNNVHYFTIPGKSGKPGKLDL
ncbi:Uncharacterised protein [Candidatus Venteria ishoeyi]|uniref:Uncharacterized protein n=1 Tax=Candidatus Venteria ishoeyi TaxID=1899563 RepID=A0A1H6F665_9GAMM|nr:Uncharacterised protein [Candidatus Venteria ishoeyi]